MRVIGAQPFDYDEVAGSAACFPSGAGHESLAAAHDDVIYKVTVFVAFEGCDANKVYCPRKGIEDHEMI